jgi:hypothetical protein
MRSLKSGLFAIAFAGLFGTAAVVGCSADGGGSGIDTESDPTLPDPGSSGSVVPPKGDDPAPPPDAGKGDAGKKDSGPKPEAGVDAGPPPPVEGTPCTTLNEIKQKNCGACGKAETVCLADGSTGMGKWSTYGACGNELSGGCVPGTSVTEACGNCGTVTKTCTQYCAYSAGACMGQPANSCVPGSIDYTTAGCGVSTYRNRTCGATCTYGSYSATCTEPVNPNKMTISGTLNGVVTAQWALTATQVGKKVSGTCGVGSVSTTATYPWQAVEVKNPTALTATISVYHSGTGKPLDTLIWVYKKTLPPNDDASLGACDFGAADSCITGDPCGNATATPSGSSLDWAGLENVTIPPGGKVLVYSAGYGSTVLGNFNLNLKTTKLQ